jgi:RNA-directed DNA polymerase
MSAGAYRCDLLPRQLPTRLRHGNSARKFADIDSYVHERLAIFASIKHGLRYHRNWTRRFTWAWLRGLGVYRLSGRVRSGAAHALR